MSNAVLIGLSPQVRGKKWELEQDSYTVGRIEEGTDLCILDSTVSSRHAVLQRSGNSYAVTDLQSTNGTRINGAPIEEQVLNSGDVVQFGSVELMYKLANAEQTVGRTVVSLVDHSNVGKTVRQMENMSPVSDNSDKMATMIFAAIGVILGGAILAVCFLILKNLF